MTILHEKTVLITGAAGGFGQEFTNQLLQKDNRLIVTDLDHAKLQQQMDDADAGGQTGSVLATIGSDLSTLDGANALFTEVQALNIPVDVVINNAGIGLMGRHDEVPFEAWERLMQVNLMAPMRLCSLFVPQMIERGSGHIVNIASLASWVSEVGLSAYVASKFGVRGFSNTLATELEKHNVQVSAVYPYFSRTPILESPRYGILGEENSADQLDRQEVTEPSDVVAEVIQSIEQNVQEIFPDKTARTVHRLQRYTPWLLKPVLKRFRKVNQ